MMTARPRVSLDSLLSVSLNFSIKLQLNSFENCSGVLHFPLVPVAKKSPVCTLSSRARTQLHSLTGVLIDSQGSSLANSKSTSASNIKKN